MSFNRGIITIIIVVSLIIGNSLFSPFSAKGQEERVFNFASAGDWGCTPNTIETVNNIVQNDPELVIGLGDYSYNSSQRCWLEIIDPLINKTQVTLGNHDMDPYRKISEMVEAFDLVRPWKAFDYGGVHFATFSYQLAEYPLTFNGTQYRWLQEDLMRATSNGTDLDKWIVIFYHNLAYSSDTGRRTIQEIAEFFHPLFARFGVDLVLQADNHFYERTYPILPGNDSALPIVDDFNLSQYNDPEGQVFATIGTGGQSFTKYRDKAYFVVSQQNREYGYLDVEVDGSNALNAKFYANNGTILDQFSIINQQ